MKDGCEGRRRGVGDVKRRRMLLAGVVVVHVVTRGRRQKVRIARVGTRDEIAAVITNDVEDDLDAACVCRGDHIGQIRH
jgi:hypothetical protein